MSWIAVGVGSAALVGGIAGAVISSNGAQNAAQTEAGAESQANQLQYSEFQQQQANQQPWINAGTGALSQMQGMSAQAPTFTQQDFLNNQDPAYQFDLQQGQQAIERSAAAQGGLQTGGTLKSLTNYAQGAASNEYQSAYSRFMNNQNTQFNRLASIAGTGQTATGAIGAAGTNMANTVGNNMTSLGSAQGAAQIAQGNTWGNTLSSLGTQVPSTLMQYQQMQNMNGWMTGMQGGGMGGANAASMGSAVGSMQPLSYQSPAGGLGVQSIAGGG